MAAERSCLPSDGLCGGRIPAPARSSRRSVWMVRIGSSRAIELEREGIARQLQTSAMTREKREPKTSMLRRGASCARASAGGLQGMQGKTAARMGPGWREMAEGRLRAK